MQSIWTLTFSTRHNLDAAIITSFDERAPNFKKKRPDMKTFNSTHLSWNVSGLMAW